MVANPWPLHFHAAAVVADLALRMAPVPAVDGVVRWRRKDLAAITPTVPMATMSGPAHGRGVLLHHLGQGLDPGQETEPIHAETDCVASASGGIGNEVARAFGLNYGYSFPWCRSPSWVCSTRSLTAPGERHLPQLFNIDRDISDAMLLDRLKDGAEAWNGWRAAHHDVDIDLAGADLTRADLRRADLVNVNLTGACLKSARLIGANLVGAVLNDADLRQAKLSEACLDDVSAVRASFIEADLHYTRLIGANLTQSSFYGADLTGSDLSRAQLYRADLRWANMRETVIVDANMTDADLYHADLHSACLRGVDLTQARLDLATLADGEITGCHVYGVSAWDVKLAGTEQGDLIITQPGEPTIAVDDLDAAQFINLLIHSPALRDRVASVSARLALVLAARVPGCEDRLGALSQALQGAGWISVHYDIGAAERSQIQATLKSTMRFCGAAVIDVEDTAPHIDLVKEAAQAADLPVLAITRNPDFDAAGLVEGPLRAYQDLRPMTRDLPKL